MGYLITESSRFKSLKVIREIQEIIKQRSADDFIDLAELEPESNPSVGNNEDGFHLIEVVYLDKVFVSVYNDDDDGGDYELSYEELELNTLENILDILEGGIEDEII